MSKSNQKRSTTISTRKVTLLGILCALSLIMFILENLLPPLFIPGAKIGLSNIFTLLTLVLFSPFEAIILCIIRTTLGSIIVGNLASLLYSMSAGLISIAISSILLYLVHPKISLLSISIVGAIIHNIVQNLVFSLVTSSTIVLSYLPYLALLGILSGVIVGIITYITIHKIPLTTFNKLLRVQSEKS